MSRRSHHRGNRSPRSGRPDADALARRATPDEPAAVAPDPSRASAPPAFQPPRGHVDLAPDARPAPTVVEAVPPLPGAPDPIDPRPDGGRRADTTSAVVPGCTAPQLRRFIKSRAWVPMHELRRRFGINGSDDDVTPVVVDGATIFVGLPSREGQLLGELLRAGDIGYELSLDPESPIVIGVYPMRPVPRH